MSKIINYYSKFDEWGRLDREPIEFLVNWHYIKKHIPIKGNILDNGAGPGKYSMRLASEGYRITLTDLTPRLVEVAKNKATEHNLLDKFNGFFVEDAKKLENIESDQYDASLMLGPMYHLQEESDRISAMKELHRVTKKNGIVFVAFMSRIRHIINSLSNPENWLPNNEMDTINEFINNGCFDHSNEGRFTSAYYFEIDEINRFMESQGFESIELIGSNIGAFLTDDNWDYWKEKGEEEVNKVIDLLIKRASDPYILGVSSHLLYIGRKI